MHRPETAGVPNAMHSVGAKGVDLHHNQLLVLAAPDYPARAHPGILLYTSGKTRPNTFRTGSIWGYLIALAKRYGLVRRVLAQSTRIVIRPLRTRDYLQYPDHTIPGERSLRNSTVHRESSISTGRFNPMHM